MGAEEHRSSRNCSCIAGLTLKQKVAVAPDMGHRREPGPQPGLAAAGVAVGKGRLVSCAENSGTRSDVGRAAMDSDSEGLRVGIRGVTLAES